MASSPEEATPVLTILPPPDPADIVPTPDSIKEEAAISAGLDLDTKRTGMAMKALDRKGAISDHLHRLIVFAIYIVGLAGLAMFVTLIWHMVTPWAYLQPDKLTELKQMLFSGATGAILSGLAKKHLGLKDEE